MVRCTDRPAMTIAVDLGRKATKPTNQPSMSKSLDPAMVQYSVTLDMGSIRLQR